MLLEGIDFFARWVFGDEAIVIDGVDVTFFTDHVSEASAKERKKGDCE